MLNLSFLEIKRIVMHHINSKGAGNGYVGPLCSDNIIEASTQTLDIFSKRVSKSLGHRSHGIQLSFHNTGPGSFFQKSVDLMDGCDDLFLKTSKDVAESLSQAQRSKSLAASKLIVISGVTSEDQVPFAAVIKADMQDALTEKIEGTKTTLTVLTEIFLSENQRLYKIGFVQKNSNLGCKDFPEHYSVHLFDHLMTGTESRSAAIYFYSDFLGADVEKSDRRRTQDFYEKTIEFINSQPIQRDEKNDLVDALRAELRSNEATFSVVGFSEKHFPDAMKIDYIDFMDGLKFPTHTITKDTEYIKNKLKRRQKMIFSTGVRLTTPPDQMRQLVNVETTVDGFTTIKIKGEVESQE